MPVGLPGHWLTNDRIASTRWNNETRDQYSGLLNRPAACMIKTLQTIYSEAQPSGIGGDPYNIIFDKTVYDVSYNGSKMAYGSNFMVFVDGWYEVLIGNSWSTTNPFNTATPLVGKRVLCIGKNLGGRWHSDVSPWYPGDTELGPWQEEAPLSPTGTTALIQPQRSSWLVPCYQGDVIEGFCLNDSDNFLLDAPVTDDPNPDSVTFSIYMSIEWVGRITS